MRENRRVIFSEFGEPEEVLRVETCKVRQPGPGEVCVRMLAAPINPADVNYAQGVYGEKPELPCLHTGLEGCGIVDASKSQDFVPGDMVILLHGVGTWSRFLTVPAGQLLKLNERLDPMQAAMLKINPLTALRLLNDYADLKPGDWIALNAANSGVGQCLIQLAKERGLHTICTVRQAEERREGLLSAGADVVVEDSPEAVAQVKSMPGVNRPKLAANCVGGESATSLMELLQPCGCMVTYGAMSRRSIKVPNSWLIFRNISLHGLWCTRWLQQASPEEIAADYAYLASAVARGSLHQSITAVYGIDNINEACRHARREGRNGKVILRLGE